MRDETADAKRALRARVREARKTMDPLDREAATEGFTRQLVNVTAVLGARSVSAYLSTPFEPNVRPYLNWARDQGFRTLLPISREDGLLDWTTGDGESERPGITGSPEAVGELLGPMALDDVDLILVPAAAVDRSGERVGWGRGYFDKTLGSMGRCPPVFAVVFDDELLDEVPHERHDQRVDGVVTPTAVTRFP